MEDCRYLPVDVVDTETILKFLGPIWQKDPKTTSRLWDRTENGLDCGVRCSSPHD